MARSVVRSWLVPTVAVLVAGAIVSAGCRAAPPDSIVPAVPAAASAAEDPGPAADSGASRARVASEPASISKEPAQAPEAVKSQQQPAQDRQPASGNVDEPAPPQDPPVEVVPAADPGPKTDTGGDDPVQGATYTWQDGDRTLTVRLQTELAVQQGAPGSSADIVARDGAGGNIVRMSVGTQATGDELPVFRSESGGLMTLPGGVLLVLDPEWSEAQVKSFFSKNRIKNDRVSELGYVDNGFFVETDPGFPSLNLANALAEQDGVEVSSPNWSRESVPK